MDSSTNSAPSTRRIVEIMIQLGVLIFIFGWCFLILAPFLSPIMWGIIIAITVYPLFAKLSAKLKNSPKIASLIITVVLLAFIIVPAILLTGSLVDGVKNLKSAIANEESLIPPPGTYTASWPAFTKPLVDAWQLASDNLQAVAINYKDQVTAVGKFIFGLIASTGLGILEFILSIILAGVFLIYAKEGGVVLRKIFIKISGTMGEKLANLCEVTIRNVVKGILGVAVIQTLMAGIGFAMAGVPAAGLWTFFCLIFAIIQVGVGPIVIPVMIYLFASSDTTTATIFLIWGIIIMVSDNFLKPFLLGRGAPVPMLVVFLGAIGGFIARGFIGLFLGAVILSLGYELFQIWASEKEQQLEEKPDEIR
jgi:predicted PurR-regulated permease PerM